jgi:hypothetical protein
MKEIPLTQGQVAIVDDWWFEELNQHKWCAQFSKATGKYYAVRQEEQQGRRKKIHMHRVVSDCPDGMEPHHINRDSLDNQRHNLKIVTRLEHVQIEPRNTGAHSEERRDKMSHSKQGKKMGKSSLYQGVSFVKKCKKWQAAITIRQKCHWLGERDTPEEAALLYDAAARKYYGEFARTNFEG